MPASAASPAYKVSEGIELGSNGTCSMQMIGSTVSDDGKAIKLDIYDKRGQVFPIAMAAQDLSKLFELAVFTSQAVADKQSVGGVWPPPMLLAGRNGNPLPPLRLRMRWSAATQTLDIVVGNVGVKIPMDAKAARLIGQTLVAEASPPTTGSAAVPAQLPM